MGKSKSVNKLSYLYLIGMAFVVVGFILPMFSAMRTTMNGFDFINFDNFGSITIAAILIFIGAVAGIVFFFIDINNKDLIKLIALAVSIAGGIIILFAFNESWLTKIIGKGFWKHATYGTYIIFVGWIAGIVGWVKKIEF